MAWILPTEIHMGIHSFRQDLKDTWSVAMLPELCVLLAGNVYIQYG